MALNLQIYRGREIDVIQKLEGIDGGKAFDWGRASTDYAKYRDIYPEEFYRRMIEMGLCVEGQRVLDLGTGTGVLPRNLYKYGAKFTGVDVAENQIREAGRLSREQNMDMEYLVSPVEEVDFPDETFDVITACQCFMYFDKAVILPKVYKMLKAGGRFCIMFMAYLPDEDEIAKASEELVLKYNPSWTGAGWRRSGITEPDWAPPLFTMDKAEAFDIMLPFTRESWHGRIKACRGIGASSLPPEVIAAFEKEHIAMVSRCSESFKILHYVTIQSFVKSPARINPI